MQVTVNVPETLPQDIVQQLLKQFERTLQKKLKNGVLQQNLSQNGRKLLRKPIKKKSIRGFECTSYAVHRKFVTIQNSSTIRYRAKSNHDGGSIYEGYGIQWESEENLEHSDTFGSGIGRAASRSRDGTHSSVRSQLSRVRQLFCMQTERRRKLWEMRDTGCVDAHTCDNQKSLMP